MTLQLKSVFKDLLWNYREILLSIGTKPVSIDRCKSQYKNVGLGQYKNVGFPTFLYCLFSLHLL